MERRKFTREFKLEAVKLIKDQPKNRNAAKPVLALSTIPRRVHALQRRARAAIAMVP